ncbi:DUF924 family protein [Kordiimonas marina]|uniref:DUF924 family protein n=1 Tax=Kordiimonas marina TaxID=2872312 RepID=UPI001FF2354D|nr:DUF924 family protein [Kordiimonas marina]
MIRAEDIVYFWFTEITPQDWWRKDASFDAMIRRRFLPLYEAAAQGELAPWRDTPRGRLAEIIVLDQFPRNMFRDTPRAFATDAMALVCAQEAVRAGADEALPPYWRAFLYMPYMHSESRTVHETSIELFAATPELSENLKFAHAHKDIVDRFGRYPHRNAIVGRSSTAEELAFLTQPGSGF